MEGTTTQLLDWRDRPTVRIEQAASILGIGRSLAYESVRRGEIPVIRLGRTRLVPTARLRQMLGEIEDVV